MLFRWVFRFVAMFLGRKLWEAYRRRRDAPPPARSTDRERTRAGRP